jgi:aconitate decarboxylase
MSELDKSSSTATAGPTQALSEFVATVRSDAIPSAVMERSRYQLLDTIGCAIFGAQLPASRIATTTLAHGSADESVIWGTRERATADVAALINGTAIQGFELDDFHPIGPLHVGACVVPSVVAYAESLGHVDGTHLLEAIVVGQEVGPRVSVAMGGMKLLERGWHNGSVYAPIASAAACAKLADLTCSQIENAIGVAASTASGLMGAQFEGMIKRMHHGIAARNGFIAVQLARNGFTGIKQVLEREYGGYAATFLGNVPVDFDRPFRDLGSNWYVPSMEAKKYAAMGGFHSMIELAFELRESAGLDPKTVRRVIVKVPPWLYARNFKLERPPTSIGAQMNLAYTLAVAFLDGDVFVDQYADDRLNSDDVWDFMSRVYVTLDSELDPAHAGGHFAAEISIEDSDGNWRSVRAGNPKSPSSQQMTTGEIEAKFFRLTESVLPTVRQRALRDVVLGLGIDSSSSADLCDLLVP